MTTKRNEPGDEETEIKLIPHNGRLNVRFIQEPEEWLFYEEHCDATVMAFYRCSGDKDCPGCASGERKSHRYLANVVNLDDQDQVIALQLPKALTLMLVVKYGKWGTLTDRDIELARQGEGQDTTYSLIPAEPDRKNIDKYQPLDLLEVLMGT